MEWRCIGRRRVREMGSEEGLVGNWGRMEARLSRAMQISWLLGIRWSMC